MNGIDRVNNDLGYIESNIKPCCYTCNIMKSSMSYDNFIKKLYSIKMYIIAKADKLTNPSDIEPEQTCTRCKVSRPISFFVGQKEQKTKMCSICRKTGSNLHKKHKEDAEIIGMIQCPHCRTIRDSTQSICTKCNPTNHPLPKVKPIQLTPNPEPIQLTPNPEPIQLTLNPEPIQLTHNPEPIQLTPNPEQPKLLLKINLKSRIFAQPQITINENENENEELLQCSKGHHIVKKSCFIDKTGKMWRTCNSCREKERLRNTKKI